MPDAVGVDFHVSNGIELIRVQVKTTEHPKVVDNTFRFRLDIASYDSLREGLTAGYLVLIVVRVAHPKWTRHFRRGTVVAASIHWVCLAGLPASTNSTKVTLILPFGNMLTPERLQSLFPEDDLHV